MIMISLSHDASSPAKEERRETWSFFVFYCVKTKEVPYLYPNFKFSSVPSKFGLY